jgi:hypothetical protein
MGRQLCRRRRQRSWRRASETRGETTRFQPSKKKPGPPSFGGPGNQFSKESNSRYTFAAALSTVSTFCGFELAIESTDVPACTRIWARVRAALSAA